ncbi:MAG: FAD-dependent oxidoreductase, partial [Planctomycetota bacterium]
RSGATEAFDITIIGDEPSPAYDRVNLSKFFDGRTADDLLLASRDWYDDNEITLQTGLRIIAIDREEKVIEDADGEQTPYDQLIISTGSRPFVPPVPGADSPGVFVYRTIADLESIRDACQRRGSQRALKGAVLGGGLLGLEAAKILVDLDISVSVLEMAPGLMPRQLDSEAAALLKTRVESMGVEVHLVRRTKSIQSLPDGRVTIGFSNADDLTVDILIIAAGVRPNDDLGRQCGLEIGERGGIVVNEHLVTTDPSIFAIGECASFNGHVFGLAAPCYRMADILAQRLTGQSCTFEGADESAELKLLGVQVATLGREIGDSPGGRVLTHHHDLGYRKLLLERGRVVGASCVGDWEELPQIRQAVQKTSRLWSWQIQRFQKTGSPWAPGGAIPVSQWPPDATVCSCLSIPKSMITQCIADGHNSVDAIAATCGASTACGTCRPLVQELAGQPTEVVVDRSVAVMTGASAVAMLLGVVWLFAPPIPIAESVQSAWRNVDILWRSDLAKQITGYSLLAVTILSQTFSLRKRWSRFAFGSYRFWRAMHGVLGTGLLVGVVVHTGLRLGENLNFILGCCFLIVAVLGGVVGMTSSLESRLIGTAGMWVRRIRPRLAQLHLWLTWPLPALIGLHILSFYWFSD